MKKEVAIQALEMAVKLRDPQQGSIIHSDCGSQHCAYDYKTGLQKYGLTPSMSGTGNCYDKASV
jgi:putative transposase